MADAMALIDSYANQVVDTSKKMIPIKAISPESGGSGESARADFLQSLIESFGVAVKRYSYKDESGTERPNLVAMYGNSPRTVWVIAHMDTVSEGDRSLWEYEPFEATVDGDRIYGRGINDDGQDVIAGIYALKALKESGANLAYSYGLAIVADEELGSKYGIQKLIAEGIFKKDDLIIVSDGGTASGDEIEVAEKGILWLKISVKGKQVHASTPDKGVNAYRMAIRFLAEADSALHSKFTSSNKLFEPSASTFEMTKHEKNTDSVNIIPGLEVSYMDCRVLPEYKLDDVISTVSELTKRPEFSAAGISVEVFNREDAAPPTSADSEIAELLKHSVERVLSCNPKIVGVGGGTCAAYFRQKGMNAVVWSKKPDTEHRPNEYALVSDMLVDAKVFADMCLQR